MTERKLAKSTATQTMNLIDMTPGSKIVSGYYEGNTNLGDYHAQIKLCRWFHKFDPIASTVVNRMSDMSITALRNRSKTKLNSDIVDEVTLAYYNAVAKKLRPFLKHAALEYLLHGLVVPAYTLSKVRGNLLSEYLGRTRYTIPDKIWVRNPDNLILRKQPLGMDRTVYMRIPNEDIALVTSKGIRIDGNKDYPAYQYLVENAPEYVASIISGDTLFRIDNARPIMRKVTSFENYPTPFLVAALGPLQHKAFIKAMDKSIASRAIEMIRHMKVGDKDFPADDDDIKTNETLLQNNQSSGERVFNLITNHTVEIEWIVPPLDALLSEEKYSEPNADIFLGLGFPRILTTGETLRSNSSDSKIASLGPKATLDDLRENILIWLDELYRELAEENGFKRYPQPYFAPIATTDTTALVQFAIQALQAGAISRNTVSELYNTDYETEADQIENEVSMGVLSPTERVTQQAQEFQVEQQERQAQIQKDLAKTQDSKTQGGNNNANTR